MEKNLKVIEKSNSDFPWVVQDKTGLVLGRFTTKTAAENAKVVFSTEMDNEHRTIR